MASLIVAACGGLYLLLLVVKSSGVLVSLRAQRRAAAAPPPLPEQWMMNVTVLQPILSGDIRLPIVLGDTIEALAHVQFVWLIDRDDRAAQDIAESLQRAHPAVRLDVQLFDAAPAGVNPKMFKLAGALGNVATPIAVVLDDDARLSAASLRQMVTQLERADLVTALPFYRETSQELGGALLAQFVNNNAALTYLALLPVAEPVSINGMCYAIRTASVAFPDALAPVLTQLADDLALARLFQARGLRIIQSTAAVEMETSTPTLRRYRQQMHRWFLFATLLLHDQSLFMQLTIALLYGVPALLLTGMLVGMATSWTLPAILISASVLLVRALTLIGLQRALTGRPRHRPLLSIISELSQPLHLLHALVDRTIIWRTRTYRVRANDDFTAV
jgi:ceramide glucosyltransferase